MYSRDLAGTRFSPLAQITTDNVARLTQAWAYPLTTAAGAARGAGPGRGRGAAPDGDGDAPPPGRGRGAGPADGGANAEATPIVIDGIMYLPAGNRVIAIDGSTGREVWRHQLSGLTTARGVAYWPGEGTSGPRILLTAGQTLVALDAATGQPAAGFGAGGAVDITVPWNGVPTVIGRVAILGATVGELPVGPPGDTRAFDVRTGAKLWEFHTVPRRGERGNDTWGDGWEGRSGTNVWGWYLTADQARGIVYMGVGGPAANYWGGDRPGNNLFGNSIVAVQAETGKYLWHFQTVHHDLWDSDMPSPPVLLDITRGGQRVPALAQIGKTGWMFILNRVTGESIFGVEERPVPAGDVPGEWYSPTQPFPLKPPALARVSFNEADMVRDEDTTPEHAQACRELWDRSGGFFNAGPFTPFMFHEEGAPPRSTIQFPGGTGGVNWGGPAADPRTGYVYVNSHDGSLVGWIERKKPGLNYGRGTDGSPQPFDRASVNGPGPYFTFSAPVGRDENGRPLGSLPCQRPPWGRLIAVDANTGDIAWQVPLGITEALPEGKQNMGASGSAGPTVTAGGLVFVGATNDSRFRAFDAKSGRELWVTKLARTVNANPMSYRGRDGKQYVAAVATDTLVAFALP